MSGIVRTGLHPEAITANLRTRKIGREVIVFNSTASTNDVAWQYAKNKSNDGIAIFAEQQTAGRGRGGTKWLGGTGESILCSIVLLDCRVNPELLILACAVAAAEAVGRCGRFEARIRWPNDIVLGTKKVGGILLESKLAKGYADYVVGTGINCHQGKDFFTGELKDCATSIDLESGKVCDRTLLAKRLLVSIDEWQAVAQQSSEKVVERWRQLSTQLGSRVRLQYDNRTFVGNCIGVDPEKGLIVQLERGGVRMFDAARTRIVRQA